MENTGLTNSQRNKLALNYGLLLAAINIVLSTVSYMLVNNFIVFGASGFVTYVLYIVLLGFFAARIRKANGGYLEFKEAFGAIFVMLAVGGVVIYIYNDLYTHVFVPDFSEKLKATTLTYWEKKNIPDEQMDKITATLDKAVADNKQFSIGKMSLGMLTSILRDCLFGLIPAAIVKRNRPLFDN